MNEPSIGIVIVNYNGAKFQNECIGSILSSNYSNYKIIIVDNASTDNSMEQIDCFNDDRIIKIYNSENYGVAEGNNIGIKKSLELGLSYTLLLNNDTVLDKDLLKNLVLALDNDEVIVPKILFWNTDLIWYGGGKFVRAKCVTKHLNYGKKSDDCVFKKYYEYAPTCCMLVKNTLFKKVGLMDEKYFLYFDDTDFCMRLKINGVKIRFVENAVIYHKVSLSTGGSMSKVAIYYENRNRYYFYEKYKKYFPFSSYIYFHWTRKIKYLMGVIKKDNNRVIKKSIQDYRNGKLGRCDDL